LQNLRHIDFGVRHCGTRVNDVELPPWAKNQSDFVEKLSQAMESDYVSKHINKWIDLIFGYKQRGKAAEMADNLFYYLCYEGSVDLDTIQDLEQRYALEVQIGEFGQVPKQLFTSPHPSRFIGSNNQKLLSNDILASAQDMEDSNTILETPAAHEDHSRHLRLGDDKFTFKFWKNDMTGMKMICDYKVHKEPLSTLAMSVDNLWIFSSSHDSKLRMYSLEEMQLLRSVSLGTQINISCCYPLPNNKTVLIGSWDNSICTYRYVYLGIHGHGSTFRVGGDPKF
jgi:factor associated with neutral sphingomyelinase activation